MSRLLALIAKVVVGLLFGAIIAQAQPATQSMPAATPTVTSNAANLRYSGITKRAYNDVYADIEFAIAEHNFRITGGNEIGGAIANRGHAGFPPSDIIHFCNLEYARKLLTLSADFLLHMPCKIVLYQHSDGVVVETRLLSENDPQTAPVAAEVNAILRAIVDYATAE